MTSLFKRASLVALATLTFSNVSMAATQQGGFTGPSASASVTTVKAALDAKDKTPVILTGHILKSLGDEKYTFKDATGEMTIEIDQEDWRGVNATPETELEIQGEVDADILSTTVEVNIVRLKK